jgi:DNA-binding NarL/FixJ family response regulator
MGTPYLYHPIFASITDHGYAIVSVWDGREVLRNLDRSLYPHTKIVVCSNMSDNQLMQEVLDNGADKFVLKSSLAPKELQALIKGLVNG